MKNTASIKVVKGIAEMRRLSLEARKRGHRIGLVPTMGALHPGHLALVKAAKRRSDMVVVSIFVNPLQFGPREDLSTYPRDLDGDLAKLQDLGVAVAFTPEVREIYPPGHRTHIEVEDLSQRLCGRARPTHFRGVATVVFKLLQIVQPHNVWFGQKDYQQLLVARRMVRDLNLEADVQDVQTVRDPDGLAWSSRNVYLSPEQRPAALALHHALGVAERIIAKGERSAAKIISNMRELIRAQTGAEVEYLSVCHPETLHELDAVEVRTLIAVAARVGKTRLIDNVLLDLRQLAKGEGPSRALKAATAAAAAKKAAAQASAPAKKPSAKKPSVKKPVEKKAAVKSVAAKAPAPAKPAAKKPVAKKPASAKPTPKTTPTKKPAAKGKSARR